MVNINAWDVMPNFCNFPRENTSVMDIVRRPSDLGYREESSVRLPIPSRLSEPPRR